MVKGTGKIGACPKNPELLHELVRQQRRACNLAIACFMEVDRGLVEPKGPDLEQTALRATIRDFVRSEVEERGGAFRSADCDEALDAAIRTRDAVIRRRKEGEGCGFLFAASGTCGSALPSGSSRPASSRRTSTLQNPCPGRRGGS